MAVPIGLIIAGAQMIAGGVKSAKNKDRPEYAPSAEDKNALALAKMMAANKDMPGQQGMEDQISLATANALSTAKESGSAQELIPTIHAGENKANRDLGIAAAEHQRGDVINYQSALGVMGGKKDLAFQMNEFAPYAQNYQESRQLVGAGMQNASNALMMQEILKNMKTTG